MLRDRASIRDLDGFTHLQELIPIRPTQRGEAHVYTAKTSDDKMVVVKFFVARDPETLEASWKKAADANLVPPLRAFTRLSRVWCVAMYDFLDGYQTLAHIDSPDERARWVTAAQLAAGHFHALGLVHGDMRPSNIMVPKRRDGEDGNEASSNPSNVRIIDLDWCSPASIMSRYPDNINTTTLRRPSSVVPGAVMTTENDILQISLFDD